jgi:hypothetical protein
MRNATICIGSAGRGEIPLEPAEDGRSLVESLEASIQEMQEGVAALGDDIAALKLAG